MKKETATRVVELVKIISELEKAIAFLESSDTMIFTTPGRKETEWVTIDNSEETQAIISSARESTLEYVRGKLKKYSSELENL